MDARLSPTLRIADLRVDPALDEICKDGKIIKVEPRTMRLLVVLAEHPGQVMSVEQLLDEVWKDVVVSPDSVYQAIATLRRLLGDDPKEPKYIANVLRRGYRLVAPVAPWVEAPAARAPPPDLPAGRVSTPSDEPAAGASIASPNNSAVNGPRRLQAVAISAALVVALGGLAGALWIAHRHDATLPFPAPAASNLLSDKSIAVLPFADVSEKKDQEYFADGYSEELINLLNKIPGLHVPARNSSFHFKRTPATISEISQALGVAYLLQGSVRRSGNAFRVTAQLVRADNGLQVWSDSYESPVSGVFKTQEDIVSTVVRVLKLSSLGARPRRTLPTTNSEAYMLYLQATFRAHNASAQDNAAATELLRQAVTLDPKFALAWGMLAMVWIDDMGWHDSTVMLDPCGHARPAATEAVRLDPMLAQAHAARAVVLAYCEHDPKAGEIEIKRALAIDPDNPYVWRRYSEIAASMHQRELSLRLAQESAIRDPLDAWAYMGLGFSQSGVGQLMAAEASFRKASELEPALPGVHAAHANSLLGVNRPAEALAEAKRETDEQFRLTTEPLALDALGRNAEADTEIAEFIAKYSGRDSQAVAEFYACRHDAPHALEWVAKMTDLPEDFPNRVACFKNIERDPRYQALLSKLKKRD
jgi:TolB-like protein/DNA-binding winged helix-turn-helix (wHTH) protein